MIHINNISFSHGTGKKKKYIFTEFDLRIEKGEFVSILGRSGCGKTTLSNILAGYKLPETGEVRIDDIPVTSPGKSRMLVNQEHDLFDWMSVNENMRIANSNKNVTSRLLSLVHLQEYEDMYPSSLSGGLKKKLSLARALATDPAFIILDEPFSSLDHMTKLELQPELDALFTKSKKTTLMVTHDIDEAMFFSDRIIVLKGSPARIVLEEKIPWAHPRKRDKRTAAAMEKIRKKILASY
jgi:ABC-type nitrate/sulfonate/bicarbonate transport system ATPase subunit